VVVPRHDTPRISFSRWIGYFRPLPRPSPMRKREKSRKPDIAGSLGFTVERVVWLAIYCKPIYDIIIRIG
jgi:hypothetical protein